MIRNKPLDKYTDPFNNQLKLAHPVPSLDTENIQDNVQNKTSYFGFKVT